MTGQNFRLPTEAEWEYAARGGINSKHYLYSGSNTLKEVAWYSRNNMETWHNIVAKKKPNEIGCYDMSGNVWEWCFDIFGRYDGNTQINPTGSSVGLNRVIRGGGWIDVENNCRLTYRKSLNPDSFQSYIGLRLALSK